MVDSGERVEDDYNLMDDVSRGESSRDENPSMYDNLESDETEEEMGDMKSTSLSEKQSSNTSQTPDTGTLNMKMCIRVREY